jgi:hypothetical protein
MEIDRLARSVEPARIAMLARHWQALDGDIRALALGIVQAARTNESCGDDRHGWA